MDINHLCINCMNETYGGVCRRCGFDPAKYKAEYRELLPNTVLHARYLTGRAIASGGFGIVYIGMDLLWQQRVAIKEFFVESRMFRDNRKSQAISLEMMTETEQKLYQINRHKFENEAQILMSLPYSPGIVRAYDYFKENETSYLIMEYLPGDTLEKLVRRKGPVPYERAVPLLAPVMNALSTLHGHGILHRDISPDNIKVPPGKGAKLYDFGGAKLRTTLSRRSEFHFQKEGYTPIEQMQSDGKLGPWTDVYALAATLYFCLCGEPPMSSTSRAGNEDDAILLSRKGIKISRRAEKAVLKGLAVRSAERWQSVAEFQKALEKAL